MSSSDLLKAVPLFSGLNDQYIDSIAKLARARSFSAGQTIISEGDAGVGLYVIVSGRVQIVQKGAAEEITLGWMGPGEVFGELALLTHRPRLATVRAVTATTCLIIVSVTFEKMLDHSPEVGKHLAQTLARWLEQVEHGTGDPRATFRGLQSEPKGGSKP